MTSDRVPGDGETEKERFSNRPALREVAVGVFWTEDGRYEFRCAPTGWLVHRVERVAGPFEDLTAAGNWAGDQVVSDA